MKKNYSFIFILFFAGLFSLNGYSQKMSSKDSWALYTQTKKMDIDLFENLIMFNLTGDKSYHEKAVAVLNTQMTNLKNLEANGTGDEFFPVGVDLSKTSAGSSLTIYDSDYYLDGVLKDTDKKSKKVTFKDQDYMVTKKAAKEVSRLEDLLKNAVKSYGK